LLGRGRPGRGRRPQPPLHPVHPRRPLLGPGRRQRDRAGRRGRLRRRPRPPWPSPASPSPVPPPSEQPAGRPVVAVGLVARDRAGRLLLVERGHPPHEGRWSLPGGRVEGGETIAEAAARELREETGLEARVGEIAGIVERIGEGFHYLIVDLWAELADDAVPGAGGAAARGPLVGPGRA